MRRVGRRRYRRAHRSRGGQGGRQARGRCGQTGVRLLVQWVAPSAPLLQVQVGFALPRPLNEAPDDERNAQVGFVITDRGTWAETSSGTTAPPVPSAQAFCMALFSTILPALVDMPAALSQWFALGRTALQLERTRGWQAADGYV